MHPRAEPEGASEQGSKPRAQRGLVPGSAGAGECWRCARGACLFGRLLTLPLASFLPPIPPTPFPSGEGGESRLFHARGSAPCIPGLSRRGRRNRGANRAPSGGLSPGGAYSTSQAGTAVGGLVSGGAGGGGVGGFSETGTSRGSVNNKFERSSGGSGGLFQESPGALPAPRKARNRTTEPIPSHNTIYYG